MSDESTQTPSEPEIPRLACHCGAAAVLSYAFPGQPKRGLCDAHEKSVPMWQEVQPGQIQQAAVDRLDGGPAVPRY